jgi:hypothetical protein
VQALQRAYVDPSVNLLFSQLRRRLHAAERAVERLRDEVEATGAGTDDPKSVLVCARDRPRGPYADPAPIRSPSRQPHCQPSQEPVSAAAGRERGAGCAAGGGSR